MKISFQCNIPKEVVLNHYKKAHPQKNLQEEVIAKWMEKPYDHGICDGVCFKCGYCGQCKDPDE
jgi:hypothetical protein